MRPFRPDQVQGLGLWLDANDVSTIVLDGSNTVSQWLDKSGLGRHASQGSPSFRPSYPRNNINGLNGVVFVGTNKHMAGTSLIAADGGYTMFGVAKKLESIGGLAYFAPGPIGLSTGSSGAADKAGFMLLNAAWPFEPSTLALGAVICQSLRRQPGVFKYNRGGVQLSSTSSPASGYGNSYLLGFHTSGSYQNVAVCECLFYDRVLSDEETARIEAYLKAKWGTT